MGHWDEHLAVQSFIDEAVVNCNNPWVNNDLIAFLLGVAQHEVYDLCVNERPINLARIDFARIDLLREEFPSIFVNLIGIGVALWNCFSKYEQDKDKVKLRRRLLGLLGAITPDLLEGLRLVLLPDGQKTWMRGDANKFHLCKKGDNYFIDTFDRPEEDLQRRLFLQKLALSLELFRIQW